MNHRRHWNNESYIMYIAWINTITRVEGGVHKVQAFVQEVFTAVVLKGALKPAYGLFPLPTVTLSFACIWHLVIHWKGQSAWAVTPSVWRRFAPHLQCELHRESIHKTPEELAISWQPNTISVWLCLPFNINTVISSLPLMPVVSHLTDKWQHTTVEPVLLHFFFFFLI